LEHTEYLGDTLELIAGEKAGIIKENVPVVIGWQKDACVENVFKKIAGEKKAPLVFAEKEVSVSVKGYEKKERDACVFMEAELKSRFFEGAINASLRLLGEFQAKNAATATLAVKTVFKDISLEQIEKGLANAFLPARFEILSGPKSFDGIKSLVLDGAHTVNSVRYTMETFKKVFGSNTAKDKAVLLFACASDKDVEDIAPCFKGSFASVFLTKPGNEKGSDLPRLNKAFDSASIEHVLIEDCEKGIISAFEKASREKSLLLVTGSFYLVSEVRKLLW
ncbi:MAG: bifunctional folylpolyglutamate synthase/dihydrofolate synthase, partial [Treponema sp.]|nr:bifunctional folylpolyglutamate synthase/dihydrofolate synthase [Treponema sp.]